MPSDTWKECQKSLKRYYIIKNKSKAELTSDTEASIQRAKYTRLLTVCTQLNKAASSDHFDRISGHLTNWRHLGVVVLFAVKHEPKSQVEMMVTSRIRCKS